MMKASEQIAEFLKLAEKATPGPWHWDYCSPGYLLLGPTVPTDYGGKIPCVLDAKASDDGNDCSVLGSLEDRVYIATACNLGPCIAKALQIALRYIDDIAEKAKCDATYSPDCTPCSASDVLVAIDSIFNPKDEGDK